MSCRCYVTVDGSSRTERNLAGRTLGAGVADRLEFLPQLRLPPPPPTRPAVRPGGR